MWKQAIRENYKFQTNVGVLTAQQLFTATDNTLIKLEEDLKEQDKNSVKVDRFQKTKVSDKTVKNKLAIVTDVIDTLIEERGRALTAREVKKEEQELLAILREIESKEKQSLSKEEVLKRLEELKK